MFNLKSDEISEFFKAMIVSKSIIVIKLKS